MSALGAVALGFSGPTLLLRTTPGVHGVMRGVKMALPRSIQPRPVFLSRGVCGVLVANETMSCDRAILEAVNAARRSEPLEAISANFSLAAYAALTPAEQIFAIADIERTSRGLPAMTGLTAQLDEMAAAGVRGQTDPTIELPLRIAGGGMATTFGSNFAEGTANALGADYFWMYDDGARSPNASCTPHSRDLCWAHRRNILGDYESPRYCAPGSQDHLLMGAAEATSGVALSPAVSEVFVNDCGSMPSDLVFTWTDVLRRVFGQR